MSMSMCATASASVCAVKFVNSFARRQHLFYIKGGSTLQWSAEVTGHHKAQVPGDVDSNFFVVSCFFVPVPVNQFRPKCNQLHVIR